MIEEKMKWDTWGAQDYFVCVHNDNMSVGTRRRRQYRKRNKFSWRDLCHFTYDRGWRYWDAFEKMSIETRWWVELKVMTTIEGEVESIKLMKELTGEELMEERKNFWIIQRFWATNVSLEELDLLYWIDWRSCPIDSLIFTIDNTNFVSSCPSSLVGRHIHICRYQYEIWFTWITFLPSFTNTLIYLETRSRDTDNIIDWNFIRKLISQSRIESYDIFNLLASVKIRIIRSSPSRLNLIYKWTTSRWTRRSTGTDHSKRRR